MRRREFIAFIGGAAAIWPRVARAQQTARMRPRAAVVFNPQTAPYTQLYMRSIDSAAPLNTVSVTAAQVHDAAEIERVLIEFARVPGAD